MRIVYATMMIVYTIAGWEPVKHSDVITDGGANPGALCIFPFRFQNQ